MVKILRGVIRGQRPVSARFRVINERYSDIIDAISGDTQWNSSQNQQKY
jgi:hypothetical protein